MTLRNEVGPAMPPGQNQSQVDLLSGRNTLQQAAGESRHRKSQLAVNLGLGVNLILALVKTLVGILGHSPALLAEGINSSSDVAYYIVVLIFIRLARKPADNEHPYGHSQLESIASLVVGAFILTTGVAVFWDSINNVFDLISGQITSEGAALPALWVALGTVVVKILLLNFTRRLGRETGNPAVVALAYDHRNDVLSASSATVGIFLGRQGYPWVDPLVGALVALLILRTGIELLRQSSNELMDAVPSQELCSQISEVLLEEPDVRSVEEVLAHRFGPYLVVNLTIGVDGDLKVTAGDQIATRVENLLYEHFELIRQVYVHYHPVSAQKPDDPHVVVQPGLLDSRK
jgi:cation diffusion facilitator family transporter